MTVSTRIAQVTAPNGEVPTALRPDGRSRAPAVDRGVRPGSQTISASFTLSLQG